MAGCGGRVRCGGRELRDGTVDSGAIARGDGDASTGAGGGKGDCQADACRTSEDDDVLIVEHDDTCAAFPAMTRPQCSHCKDAISACVNLELLVAVVETRSFVGAGERLGLTQSGTSRAVARLEARVGVRLFDRNARAVTLTDEGRRFYARVAPLHTAIEDAVDEAA